MEKLDLAYLTDDRAETFETISVDSDEFARLAKAGKKIIENGGEFSSDEIADMDDMQFARLAASSERGSDAYSLACSSYLA